MRTSKIPDEYKLHNILSNALDSFNTLYAAGKVDFGLHRYDAPNKVNLCGAYILGRSSLDLDNIDFDYDNKQLRKLVLDLTESEFHSAMLINYLITGSLYMAFIELQCITDCDYLPRYVDNHGKFMDIFYNTKKEFAEGNIEIIKAMISWLKEKDL